MFSTLGRALRAIAPLLLLAGLALATLPLLVLAAAGEPAALIRPCWTAAFAGTILIFLSLVAGKDLI